MSAWAMGRGPPRSSGVGLAEPASAPAARSDRAAGGQSNNGSAGVMGAGAGLRRLWQTEALRITSGLEVAASMGLARGPTDRA